MNMGITRFDQIATLIGGRFRCKVIASELLARLSTESFEDFLNFVKKRQDSGRRIAIDTPLIWEVARILGDPYYNIKTKITDDTVIEIALRSGINTVLDFEHALSLRSQRLSSLESKKLPPKNSRWRPSYNVFKPQNTATYSI